MPRSSMLSSKNVSSVYGKRNWATFATRQQYIDTNKADPGYHCTQQIFHS